MILPKTVYRCKVCGRIDEATPKSYVYGWHWAANDDKKCRGEWEEGRLVFQLASNSKNESRKDKL